MEDLIGMRQRYLLVEKKKREEVNALITECVIWLICVAIGTIISLTLIASMVICFRLTH